MTDTQQLAQRVTALLEGATVVRLQPGDVVVLRLAKQKMLSPDVTVLVRAAFAPHRVVILSAEVDLGVAGGDVRWLTDAP